MKEAVKIPIKFIHVVRNPFDIVGRIVYRRGYNGKREDLKGPVCMGFPNFIQNKQLFFLVAFMHSLFRTLVYWLRM